MIRHVAAVAVALCLSSSPVSAQTAEPQAITALTVKTPANVHKSPTTASPIVGTASRGAVLEVTRNLGSWVQVPWAEGEKGLAYVHVSSGTIARSTAPQADGAAAAAALHAPA